jgi:hypothetical protein
MLVVLLPEKLQHAGIPRLDFDIALAEQGQIHEVQRQAVDATACRPAGGP